MCYPALYWGAALLAAGTVAQQRSQSMRADAQARAAEKTRLAEASRQDGLREERFKNLGVAQTNADMANQQALLDAAASKREGAYAPATDLPGDGGYQSPAASSAPRVVQAEHEAQRDAADQEVGDIGTARARLNAFGDLNLGNRTVNSNAANQIDMLGGFARQSAALLPGEVQAAINSKAGVGSTLGTIGNIATIVGGAMMGGAGAAGAGGAAASTAGTTAAGTGFGLGQGLVSGGIGSATYAGAGAAGGGMFSGLGAAGSGLFSGLSAMGNRRQY